MVEKVFETRREGKATEMDAQPMDFDDDDEYNNNNKSFSPRKENNNDPVSVALSRNDVVLATQLAMNDGDIRLATIIAQSGASDNIKNLQRPIERVGERVRYRDTQVHTVGHSKRDGTLEG